MKIDDIIGHEKKCPDRLVTCPYLGCKKEVKLKMLGEHTKENDCIDDWEDIEEIHCGLGDIFLWPYDLYDWDNEGTLFNPNEDKSWKLPIFYVDDQLFYIFMHYLASKQSFFHCVILPDDVETASKYNARMILGPHHGCVDSRSRRRLTYEGPVLSIEDLPDLTSSSARSKYWIVPYEDMEPFYTGNPGPGLVQVCFSVNVYEIEAGIASDSISD